LRDIGKIVARRSRSSRHVESRAHQLTHPLLRKYQPRRRLSVMQGSRNMSNTYHFGLPSEQYFAAYTIFRAVLRRDCRWRLFGRHDSSFCGHIVPFVLGEELSRKLYFLMRSEPRWLYGPNGSQNCVFGKSRSGRRCYEIGECCATTSGGDVAWNGRQLL
jgi:hypothetical protein